jgi:hypothetical protein
VARKRKKKFIQKAIKRPGRMKEGAAREGMSVRAYEEKEKHSSDPSMRSAANLGLRFGKGGDLHRSRKHSRKRGSKR